MGILTKRFDEALSYALSVHRAQVRKGTEIPYAAHLLAVASLVLEAGGDETTAIVGLLHDVVEDQGAHHLDEVRGRFGDAVADAVLECSAEDNSDGLGWRERKERYIAQMRIASPMALQVSLADKVHNLRSIVADYRLHGAALFDRFNAPNADAIVWDYASLAEVYRERALDLHPSLVAELERTLAQLRQLLARPDCPNGHGDVVPVIMGMPDRELVERAEAGEVSLGGCIVDDAPDWSCRVCDAQWRDGSIDPASPVGQTGRLVTHFLPQLREAWDTMGVGTYDVSGGYVQWARFEGGLQIECVSNQFLEDDWQLGFAQRRALELLGFHRPAPPAWPNYFRRFEDEIDLPLAAELLARVATDVLEALAAPVDAKG